MNKVILPIEKKHCLSSTSLSFELLICLLLGLQFFTSIHSFPVNKTVTATTWFGKLKWSEFSLLQNFTLNKVNSVTCLSSTVIT